MNRLAQARNLALTAAAFSAIALSAQAGPTVNYVTNGDFNSTNCGTSNCELGNGGGYGDTSTGALTGWTTTSGYSWVVYSTGAGNSAIPGGSINLNGQSGAVSMNFASLSPTGNNFLVQDSNFNTGTLSQTLTGLTIGATYSVSFSEAAAQQSGFSGQTSDYWTVGFGTKTLDSPTLTIGMGGFSGWVQVALNFTAAASSQVLSFTAVGTGAPPFAALDGVSVQVPEPASFALLGAAVLGLAAIRRRRNHG